MCVSAAVLCTQQRFVPERVRNTCMGGGGGGGGVCVYVSNEPIIGTCRGRRHTMDGFPIRLIGPEEKLHLLQKPDT